MANDSNGSRTSVISNCIKARALAESGKGPLSVEALPKGAAPTTKVVHGSRTSKRRL